MKKLLIALAAVFITAATYGQGQVYFSNRDTPSGLNAPVLLAGTTHGPGSDYTAQLYLSSGGAFTALTPPSTFRASNGTIQDQYWLPVTVDVPGVAAGGSATFVVRAWQTSAGSFAAAISKGESAPFTINVGGGTIAPPPLTGLTGFTVTAVPEPTVIALGVLGAAAFMLRRRK